MKQNWEYKQLGSLCNIVRGGSPRPIQNYITDSADGYNWIKIGDVAPGSKYISSTKEKIKKEGLVKTRQVFIGDFILSNSMSFGRPYILKIDGCIHDGWLAIKDVENHFIPDFLYYYLSAPSTYSIFEKLVKGGVVSNLNSDIVKGIKAPVPPMEVQRQIVAELDKINEVIADCRELLRNLDTLAQSLFYDTFGDPITNPRGWETQALSEIAPQHPYNGKFSVEGDLWLLNLDMIEKNTGRIIGRYKVKYEDIGNSVYKIGPNQVLYSKLRPNLNKVVIVDEFGYCTSELLPLNPRKGLMNCLYLAYLLRTKECVNLFSGKVAGAKMPRTDLKAFRTFQIPLPPFELQERFAKHIEQIEVQKKAVEETIANLQTLLHSRMDYWFN